MVVDPYIILYLNLEASITISFYIQAATVTNSTCATQVKLFNNQKLVTHMYNLKSNSINFFATRKVFICTKPF